MIFVINELKGSNLCNLQVMKVNNRRLKGTKNYEFHNVRQESLFWKLLPWILYGGWCSSESIYGNYTCHSRYLHLTMCQ